MKQFNNFNKFLTDSGFKVTCTPEEFEKDKIIVFECEKNHINRIKNTSFINKKSKYKSDLEKLCATCLNYDPEGERFQTMYTEIFEATGHKLKSLEKERKIKYECGNCGAENQTFVGNIKKSVGTCPSCQTNPFKKNLKIVKDEVEKAGFDFVSYKNCKEVELKCTKDHNFVTTMHLLREGRGCPFCAPEKRSATNLKKYGCENVMHVAEIFNKVKKRAFAKKEFDFPNGRKAMVMGYEHLCLTQLLKKYNEEDIVVETNEIPVIYYTKPLLNGEDKKAAYYPDIFIKSANLIIEVKSTFTYKREYKKNNIKFRECLKQGYDVEVWIYTRKQELVEKKKLYAKAYNDDLDFVSDEEDQEDDNTVETD